MTNTGSPHLAEHTGASVRSAATRTDDELWALLEASTRDGIDLWPGVQISRAEDARLWELLVDHLIAKATF